jgi:hypothetical protein
LALGNGLAFLAADALGVFAHDAHALALVRLRRVVGANLGGDLTDELLVRSLDLELGAVGDGDLDALGDVVEDRVGVTQREVALEKRVSSVGATTTELSFFSIFTTGAKVLETLPLGPSTDTVVPLMSTLTLSGI